MIAGPVAASMVWALLGCQSATYLSPEQAASEADVVVRGTIEAVQTRLGGPRGPVFTDAFVRIVEVWKGEAPAGQIRISWLGGQCGEYASGGGPVIRLERGQDIVACVQRWENYFRIIGLSQGLFVIDGDAAVRRFFGLTILDRPPQVSSSGERFSMGELHRRMEVPERSRTPGSDRRDSGPRDPAAPAATAPVQTVETEEARRRDTRWIVALLVLTVVAGIAVARARASRRVS